MRAALVALAACGSHAPAPAKPVENHAAAKVAPCTDNCMPPVVLVDTSGTKYTRESLGGRVVIVNFWATWCKPCQKQIPALVKLKAQGATVISILTDSPSDYDLETFVKDNEVAYPVVRANNEILTAWQYPQALPATFVYDRDGKQVYTRVGPFPEGTLDVYVH
jgi:thiol-disulfide isomerase/thioredoxin